jgi:FixJ family two-component response regulator
MTQSRVRVAVVDDDLSVCRALARLLRASGLVAETYGSARDFLESLTRIVPECLVVDLQMPDMTGLELQQHLSAGGFRFPVIVITAHDGAGIRERCLASGAAAYLVKPVREDSLLRAINAATAN